MRGFNRYVRNPIYLGVLAIVVGEALLLGQWQLLAYAAGVWLVAVWFVRVYEEPALAARFGGEYESYRRAVPAWWPRARPGNYPDGSPMPMVLRDITSGRRTTQS